MGFHERVLDYTVSTLRNDVVDYRRVIRLTTISGGKVFLAFPEIPPADWLQFNGPDAVVYLPVGDFDATYRVLQQEPGLRHHAHRGRATCLHPRLR